MLYLLTLLVRIPLGVVGSAVELLLPLSTHFVGRANPHAGSQLLLLWIKLFQRIAQARNKPINMNGIEHLTASALLGRGASWEQIKPLTERRDKQGVGNGVPFLAFHFYVVKEQYQDAYEAGLEWCKNADQRVAGQEEDMRRFFSERPTDFWGRAKLKEYEKSLKEWIDNPQGRPRPEFEVITKEEARRIARYIGYYNSHLALEILQWMRTLDPKRMRRAKAAVSANSRRSIGLTYKISFGQKLARSMGMDEPTLNAIREQVMEVKHAV